MMNSSQYWKAEERVREMIKCSQPVLLLWSRRINFYNPAPKEIRMRSLINFIKHITICCKNIKIYFSNLRPTNKNMAQSKNTKAENKLFNLQRNKNQITILCHLEFQDYTYKMLILMCWITLTLPLNTLLLLMNEDKELKCLS